MIEGEPEKITGRFDRSNSPGLMPPSSVVWILALALMVLIVYVSRGLVLLLLVSVTLAYFLNPLVKIAEGAMIKRKVAVAVIYLGIGVGFLVTAYFVFPRLRAEVNTLSGNLPFFSQRFDAAVDAIQSEIVTNYPAADGWFAKIGRAHV